MSVAFQVGPQSSRNRELPPSMVERMTLILDTFERPSSLLTLEEIARATHLPRSTAHRILHQLVQLEWLEHSPQGYRMGRRALGHGAGERGHAELRAAAAPHLHELLMRTGAVVHLAVLEEDRVTYLDKMGGGFARRVPSRVGSSQPAHCTALGKSMLAFLDPAEVDSRVGPALAERNGDTLATLEGLHADLHRVRARSGLAFQRDGIFSGLACAAAAIHGPEGPVAALSAVMATDQPVERVAPLVVHAARQVSLDLYGELPRRRRVRALGVV